ncbi:hypothetical protein HMI50_26610 [Corallococcus carmarthensis]|nr:hypothetical protein [Corallococcus carmarthensis]
MGDITVSLPTLLNYHRPYSQTANETVSSLKDFPPLRGWKDGEIAFEVSPSVAGLCWEAMVATALKSTPQEQLHLDMRRGGSRHPRPHVTKRIEHIGIQLGQEVAQGRTMQAWLRPTWYLTPQVLLEHDGSGLAPEAGVVELLYLRASPIPTARGPRLDLNASGHSENRVQRREQILSASNLVDRMKKLRVCILVGPHLRDIQRVESDRLTAAMSRAFAADLAATGQLTAILIVPSLPEDIESDVSNLVANAFSYKDWPTALAMATQDVRTLIYQALRYTWDAWEVAMDCCLYLPPQSQLIY